LTLVRVWETLGGFVSFFWRPIFFFLPPPVYFEPVYFFFSWVAFLSSRTVDSLNLLPNVPCKRRRHFPDLCWLFFFFVLSLLVKSFASVSAALLDLRLVRMFCAFFFPPLYFLFFSPGVFSYFCLSFLILSFCLLIWLLGGPLSTLCAVLWTG